MSAVLPNPNMDFVPLDQLLASELDQMVQNIEYLATYLNTNMMSLQVSTVDIGEGAALPANTLCAIIEA